MQTIASLILMLVLVQVAPIAIADDDPVSPRYQSNLERFEDSGDLAWVYRLAWIAAIEDRPGLAHDWLAELSDGGWQMGVDTSQIQTTTLHDHTLAIVDSLQAALGTELNASRRVFSLDDAELIPESIAYDSRARVLYSGSLHKKKIVAYGAAGIDQSDRGSDLKTGVLGAVYGMKFDPTERELWVLHNRRIDGELFGKLSVFAVDGTPVRVYEPELDGANELNDLCLGKNSVFVTDSRNDAVLRGSRTGHSLQPFIGSPKIPYANGIACDENSADVFVAGATGIYRVNENNPDDIEKLSVAPGYSMGGIDGLYLHSGELIGIQNALGTPKVIVANISGQSRIKEIVFRDSFSPEFRIPTTGFINGDCLYYIANSSLDALGPDEQISPTGQPPEAAKILGLNLAEPATSCEL